MRRSNRTFVCLQTILPLFLLALAMGCSIWPQRLSAMTIRNLHVFGLAGGDCSMGCFPMGRLLRDDTGNLFGITGEGGLRNAGVVFRLTYLPDKQKWQEQVIYDFCALANCTDGAAPDSGLIRDVFGNLYGTAAGGGSTNNGIVFELSPRQHAKWSYKVLWNGCSISSKCQDGIDPIGLTYAGQQSGALYDGTSPLYGVTIIGSKGNRGVAYSLSPDGDGGWTQKVLYVFCSQGQGACTDGLYPNGDLMMDVSGNLFGTAQAGGAHNAGLVFKLTPHSKMWTETVLHDFCSEANCADGKQPWYQSMTMGLDGTIYGATTLGGNKSGSCQNEGCGVVYKIASDGTESTLYSFCNFENCTDGETPNTGLFIDSAGALYGTTDYGGEHWDRYGGTLFRLDPAGSLQTLFSFCDFSESCKNGRDPGGTFMLDQTGNIFGAMTNSGYKGGQQGEGTLIELSP